MAPWGSGARVDQGGSLASAEQAQQELPESFCSTSQSGSQRRLRELPEAKTEGPVLVSFLTGVIKRPERTI